MDVFLQSEVVSSCLGAILVSPSTLRPPVARPAPSVLSPQCLSARHSEQLAMCGPASVHAPSWPHSNNEVRSPNAHDMLNRAVTETLTLGGEFRANLVGVGAAMCPQRKCKPRMACSGPSARTTSHSSRAVLKTPLSSARARMYRPPRVPKRKGGRFDAHACALAPRAPHKVWARARMLHCMSSGVGPTQRRSATGCGSVSAWLPRSASGESSAGQAKGGHLAPT